MVRFLIALLLFSSPVAAIECRFNNYAISNDDKYIAFKVCGLAEGESSGGYFKALLSLLGWDFEFNQECHLVRYDLEKESVMNNIPVNNLFDGYELDIVEFSQNDNNKLLLSIFNRNPAVGKSFEDVIVFDIETSSYTRIFEGQENIANIYPLDNNENVLISTYSKNAIKDLLLGIYSITTDRETTQDPILVTHGEYEAGYSSVSGNILYFNSYPKDSDDFEINNIATNQVYQGVLENYPLRDVEKVAYLNDMDAHNPMVSKDGTLVFSSRKSGFDKNGNYMYNLFIKRPEGEVEQFTHYDQFVFPPKISRSGNNVIFIGQDETQFKKLQIKSTKDGTVIKISPKDINTRCDY